MKRSISICIFILAINSSVLSFSWENCGTSTSPIIIDELSVRGTNDLFYVSMKLNVTENITQPIEANLRIKRKIPLFNYYIDVPCKDNLGSCDYKDICEINPWKNEPCPTVFVKNNLPCKCPIPKNYYTVKNLPLDLRPFENEIEGTYKIKIYITEEGHELLCIKMKIKL